MTTSAPNDQEPRRVDPALSPPKPLQYTKIREPMLLSDATEDERDVGPSLIGNFKDSSASPSTKLDESHDNDEINVAPGNFDQPATDSFHMEIDDNVPDQNDATNISAIETGVEEVQINDKNESSVLKTADTTETFLDDAHMQDDAEVDHLLTFSELHGEHQASEDFPKDSTELERAAPNDVPPSLLDVSTPPSEAKGETGTIVEDVTSDNLPNPKKDSQHTSKLAARDPNQKSAIPLRNMFGFYKGKSASVMAQVRQTPPRTLSNSTLR